jgi:hypothetical protein
MLRWIDAKIGGRIEWIGQKLAQLALHINSTFIARTFMQVMGMTLTLCAAIFLAKGGFGLDPKTIAELASTKFNYNSNVVWSLANQHADTLTGAGLLVVVFFLQIVDACRATHWEDFIPHRPTISCAVILSIVIGVGASYWSQQYAQFVEANVITLLEAPDYARP